jgi:hypothetical protein
MGFHQIGTLEVGARQRGAHGIGAAQIDALEICVGQSSTPEIGALQVGTLKIGILQLCALEICVPQVGALEICVPPRRELQLGLRQFGLECIPAEIYPCQVCTHPIELWQLQFPLRVLLNEPEHDVGFLLRRCLRQPLVDFQRDLVLPCFSFALGHG